MFHLLKFSLLILFFFGMKNLLYFYLPFMSYFPKLHKEELVIFISKVYNQAAP